MYSIKLEGDVRRLYRRMQQFSELNKKGINAALGEAVRESTTERFKTQKGPDDKKWPTSHRAQESGGVTLTKSGRMRNSIKTSAASEGFAVGTNTIYASTHQLGAQGRKISAKQAGALRFQLPDGGWATVKRVKINIPARPFLGLSDEDMREIKKTLEDALKED